VLAARVPEIIRNSERNPNFDNILTLMRNRTADVLWSGHEAAAVNFIRQWKRRNVSPPQRLQVGAYKFR
jgi:hypothetical protein